MLSIRDKQGVLHLINPDKIVTARWDGEELLIEMDRKDEAPLVFRGEKCRELLMQLEVVDDG